MDNYLTRKELEKLARRWGRTSRAVGVAIASRFISPAKPHGRSRGQQPDWLYPKGTDRRLRTLYRLQNRKYRGGALRFALWWLGLMDFSPSVASYVLSVFISPRKNLDTELKNLSRKLGVPNVQTGDTIDGQEEELSFADLLTTKLEDVLNEGRPGLLEEILRRLDPTSPLTADQIAQIIKVGTASMFQLYPETLGGSSFFLEQYLRPDDPRRAQFLSEAIADQVRELHTPEWFANLECAVTIAHAEEYNQARDFLRQEEFTRKTLRVVKQLAEAFAPKVSNRAFQRIGPWSAPLLATRALLIGYCVGWARSLQKAIITTKKIETTKRESKR